VVGDGQRGELQFMGLVHQPVQPAGAIEQRILGMEMKMNKVRVRHGHSLAFNPKDTKTQSDRHGDFGGSCRRLQES